MRVKCTARGDPGDRLEPESLQFSATTPVEKNVFSTGSRYQKVGRRLSAIVILGGGRTSDVGKLCSRACGPSLACGGIANTGFLQIPVLVSHTNDLRAGEVC